MILPFIYVLTSGVSNALIGILAKQAERSGCRPQVVPLLFLGTAALCAAVALPFAFGEWGDPRLWALAVVMGLLYVRAMQSMILANRTCPPSLVWSLVNLALVVPIVLAPVLLREAWQPADALILAAFFAMLGLFRLGMEPSGHTVNTRWTQVWLPLTEVFLTNGLLMLGYKVKTLYWPEVGALMFIVLVFGSGALIAMLVELRTRERIADVEWRWGSLLGVAAAVANLSLLGAAVLPAIVVFPLIQGIALVGGTLLMVVLFSERLNLYKLGGLCCGGLVLALAVLR
ncbi:MAG: hypothetical protein ACYC7E_12680 [Armatimonadota bacterium]